MSGEYSYQRLDSQDVGLLKALLKVFGDAFEDPQTYQGDVPGEEYLRSLLGKPHFIAIAALDSDRVVGGLAAYVLEKFEQDRKEVYIYDLAVSKAHRRKGVATGLIESLRRILRELRAYVGSFRPTRATFLRFACMSRSAPGRTSIILTSK